MSSAASKPNTYSKPALSIADQLDLLRKRGLVIKDDAIAEHHLEHIGYYRFSGYTKPFQKGGNGPDREEFRSGTIFEAVLAHYVFDRKLRLIVMDAIERIEVSMRSALSNSIAIRHTPNWYQDPKLFDAKFNHQEFIENIKEQIGHNQNKSIRRSPSIRHYYSTYNSPDMPPCWMVFEEISFGTISIAFKNLAYPENENHSKPYGFSHKILSSWVHSISYLRNVCAHHSRLWNRTYTIKPIAANAYKSDLSPNDRFYAQAVVLQILLAKISPGNHWAQSLHGLFKEFPQVPLGPMGFPDDWTDRAVWGLASPPAK